MFNEITTLDRIPKDTVFIIDTINESLPTKKRLMDMGFTPGTKISKVFDSPFGTPSAYLLRNTLIALRNVDSSHIRVYKYE